MRFRAASILLLLSAAMQLPSQQPPSSIEFNKQVQPIFTENCVGCHKGANAPAGLQLDSSAGVLKGSSSGAVVVPGNSKQSLLVQRISDTNGNQMPPSGALSKDLIRIVTDWIDQGAKTDGTPAPASSPRPVLPQISLPQISSVTSAPQERALLDFYSVTCHKGAGAPAGLALDKLDPANVEKDADKWEKVVRKLRAGMMPPAGMPRPAAATYESAVSFLENALDKSAVAKFPPPGIHRLNRTEYANAIRDLLALDIDPSKYLPSDDS